METTSDIDTITTPNNEKKENKKESLVDKFKNLLHSAKDSGATPEQLGELRRMMQNYTDWNPTKKKLSKKYRKKRQNIQKKSRQINHRNRRISKYTKGIQKSGRV